MTKLHSTGVFLSLLFASPLAALGQDVEAGFSSGDTRLDNYHYGTWVDDVNSNYAVCGGDVPFVSGISVQYEGLRNNSVLCSSYPVSMFDVPGYTADPQPNPGSFSGKVQYVSDCGYDGVVVGVTQPGGEFVSRYGAPVKCGRTPVAPHACEVVEMPGDVHDYAADAAEVDGAPEWTEDASVTCGAGRYARAIAYRKYEIENVFTITHSWAMGGLICCSL